MNPDSIAGPVPPKGLVRSNHPALPGGATFIRPWLNLATIALTPMGLLAAWFTYQLFRLTRGLSADSVVYYIPIVFAGVTLIYTYVLAVRYVNRSRIEIAPDHVAVHHGPLPWRRGVRVEAAQLRRIHVQEVRVKYRGSTAIYHEVWAEDIHGNVRQVIVGEMDKAEAEFLCGECARILRLPAAATTPAGHSASASASVGQAA